MKVVLWAGRSMPNTFWLKALVYTVWFLYGLGNSYSCNLYGHSTDSGVFGTLAFIYSLILSWNASVRLPADGCCSTRNGNRDGAATSLCCWNFLHLAMESKTILMYIFGRTAWLWNFCCLKQEAGYLRGIIEWIHRKHGGHPTFASNCMMTLKTLSPGSIKDGFCYLLLN